MLDWKRSLRLFLIKNMCRDKRGNKLFTYIIDNDTSLRLPNQFDAEKLYNVIDDSREHLSQWLPWVKGTNSVDIINKRCRMAK